MDLLSSISFDEDPEEKPSDSEDDEPKSYQLQITEEGHDFFVTLTRLSNGSINMHVDAPRAAGPEIASRVMAKVRSITGASMDDGRTSQLEEDEEIDETGADESKSGALKAKGNEAFRAGRDKRNAERKHEAA